MTNAIFVNAGDLGAGSGTMNSASFYKTTTVVFNRLFSCKVLK
jgi:hypothetical protein